jgi:FkbM family methyltransferase
MGQTNPFETKLVRKYLKQGDTFFQIGAYRDGWLGLVGSSVVGPEGSIICFEPIPEYAESLRKNIALNNSQNIMVEQLAISDATGEAQFSTAGNNSSLVLKGKSGNVTVETIPLDEYVLSRGVSKIDFLIVDVEGAEPLVLKGARRTLQTLVSFLLMEVIDDFLRQANSSADELIQTVVAIGFHPYIITRRGLVAWAPGKTSETLNMFFSKRHLVTNEP